MAHIEGESRYQRSLIAPSLDELVGSDDPVRVIDAFVEALDLAGLNFRRVVAAAMGRPPYRPSDLLKLYVYGYLNQLRSSRRLEREAARNLEVLWLINRVSPSFKTIADFRRDHPEAIVGVCRAFVRFCRRQSLYGGELVAIDGSKIEAVASRKKVITPKSLAKQAASLDRKIAEYLAAMDEADRDEAKAAVPVDVAAALAALREKRATVQSQAAALAAEDLTQQVIGEPDAKLMRTARHGPQVAYNAQTVVDAQHGLIAAFDLTSDGNDHCQLLPMALQGKEALGAETLTVVADTGYSNGEQADALRQGRCHGDRAAPQDGQSRGQGVLQPRGLRLRRRQRQLDLPGRRDADLPRYLPYRTQEALHDEGLRQLRPEAEMHQGQSPGDHPRHLRGPTPGHAPTGDGRPEMDEAAARAGRAPIRHHEMGNGAPSVPRPRTNKG
jgi:transposase